MKFALLTLLLAVGCGGKKAPPEAAAAPASPPASAAAPTPAPPPEPEVDEPPAPPASNIDLNVTMRFADGSVKTGHVKRVERSTDFFGEEDWDDSGRKLVIEAEAGTVAKDLPWTQVKSVSVFAGRVPADVSCTYNTEYTPWMYDCTLTTTGKVVDTTGKTWTISNRNKWRFTFSDDSTVEFWLYKYAARQQDDHVVDLDTTNPENLDLYAKLQGDLRQAVKSKDFVTSIQVQ